MENLHHSFQDSIFISKNTLLLLSRFSLSYRHEFSCVDYYINDIETGICISKEILFTLDRLEGHIVVSRFYPELSKRNNSKYLSATCFYLMIHHFSKILKIPSGFDIYLTAKPSVFKKFYEKLNDFDFHIQGPKTDNYVNVTSTLNSAFVDTSMITLSSKDF